MDVESSLPKSFQPAVHPTSAVSESSSRKRLGGKKDSEWVFRPLKLKFKVKELEHLYNNAVYRQRQALLLGACVLMTILSLLIFVVYLIGQKVREYLSSCLSQHWPIAVVRLVHVCPLFFSSTMEYQCLWKTSPSVLN